MMTRRNLLGGSLAAPYISRAAARKTNVVFILTDDHGAWALNCYGCKDIRSPNVDRLAAGGARFTRAYACTPVCSASRADVYDRQAAVAPRRAGLPSNRG